MKKYCLDTSGLSNPLITNPEDIFISLWRQVRERIESGIFAVTTEIYDEMTHIRGETGKCIVSNASSMRLEINNGDWDWRQYIVNIKLMQNTHRNYIAEYNRNRSKTVGLNDIAIIALGKTLRLPVISMEDRVPITPGSLRRRIPNICDSEGIVHCTFNEFLRKEGIVV